MTGGKPRPRARAALRRWLWFVRFQLFHKRRLGRVTLAELEGHHLVVTPGVFHPLLFFTSSFLARVLERLDPELRGASVLDLGCGSGVLSIVAAKRAARVVATDLSPQAVTCTRINAILNGVEEKVSTRQGDLFDPLGSQSFQVILFNPPFLEGRPRNLPEASFRGGDLAVRFAEGLPAHLETDGFALLVLSSRGLDRQFLQPLLENNFVCERIAEKDLVAELLTVYRVSRKVPEAP